MALDLEEQEQVAELKAWWNQYGNLVVSAIVAAALTLAGVALVRAQPGGAGRCVV
jgi:predicted negative regulator of RcsB-dependent stress response